MSDMERYIREMVDPTLDDFAKNPGSARYAFLACVAAYHSIDRGRKSTGNLRKEWHSLSPEFLIVDMVAHHFKHVRSGIEKAPTPSGFIPLSFLVFGDPNVSKDAVKPMDTRNLYFVVRDAVKFLRKQAEAADAK